MSKIRTQHRNRIIAALILLLAAVAVGLCLLLSAFGERRSDYQRIRSERYDSVLLSMFPVDNYEEESFAYWRGQTLLKASGSCPNLNVLRSYLERIARSGNEISCIYLGVLPDRLSADELSRLLAQYPSVHFQVMLPYPSMDYWRGLSDAGTEEQLAAYREVTDTLIWQENVSVYLFTPEWLLCNPANYEDDFLTSPDISLTLMLNCDQEHSYVLTPENTEEAFTAFRALLETERSAPTSWPDLSDCRIVFFGDSVIGNYTDSASIPGVVNGLTGAAVYNCGYGGNHATYNGTGITLPGIADALVQRDLSELPADQQVYRGIAAFLQDTSGEESGTDSDSSRLCFVINYGLNDYFNRFPISSEDPYDIGTFEGALRTAVRTLQDAYPDARILLMTPNYTSYSDAASDSDSAADPEESGAADPLPDYVNAVLSVGAERGVTVLDNYAELGIDRTNHGSYLLDGVHPNEATRFTIGRRIALALR